MLILALNNTHSLTRSLTHSLARSLAHSLTHKTVVVLLNRICIRISPSFVNILLYLVHNPLLLALKSHTIYEITYEIVYITFSISCDYYVKITLGNVSIPTIKLQINIKLCLYYNNVRSHRRRDRLVFEFTTTYVISAYHHWFCEFESRSGCTALCDKVCQWLATDRWFFRFPPPIKLTPRYIWNIVESGIKHHQTNNTVMLIDDILAYLCFK